MRSGTPPGTNLPVLTDVVQVEPLRAPVDLQQHMVRALPAMVRDALNQVRPELEQQLLDALMPRLLAAVSVWQAEALDRTPRDGPRLP